MTSASQSTFLEEVEQHPAALRTLIAFYRGEGRTCLTAWAAEARRVGQVSFVGMGTSVIVAELVQVALARQGIDISTLDAGELLHYPRPVPSLLVLVSQSGESFETVEVMRAAAGTSKIVALVNTESSTLARQAAFVLPMHAGYESAVSTKTYVNSLAVLYLMAQAVAGEAAVEKGLDALEHVAEAMASVDSQGVARAADLLADARAIQFIARGPALVAAKQAMLTYMEGTRTPCSAFTGGGFRHGPFELVDAAFRCVFFVPEGKTAALLGAMAAEVAQLGGRVVAISDHELTLPAVNCQVLRVPALDEQLFPLVAAPTQELLLHEVAARRGVQAGIFRHGGKVTTRE